MTSWTFFPSTILERVVIDIATVDKVIQDLAFSCLIIAGSEFVPSIVVASVIQANVAGILETPYEAFTQ